MKPIEYGAWWSRALKCCFTCGGNPCLCREHDRKCGCVDCHRIRTTVIAYRTVPMNEDPT